MEEETLQKILKLTTELTAQQQSNQELASGLQGQLSDLRQKALAKYSDVAQDVYIPSPLLPEQRDEVLETLKSRLEQALAERKATQIANKELEKECSDLYSLVKEYEVGLETIASKLRTHASATVEGQMQLRREYEALLNAEKGTTAALFMENTMLQTQLRELSSSVRELYRHEGANTQDEKIAQLQKENQDLFELLQLSKLSNTSITEKSSPVLQVARQGVIREFFTEE